MSVIGNSPGVASQRVVSPFTATSGQTTFTPISGYTLGYCDVFLNGIKLANGDDYTASNGATVVLAVGAALGDFVEIVAYFPRGLSDGYLKSEADGRFQSALGYTAAKSDGDAVFVATLKTGGAPNLNTVDGPGLYSAEMSAAPTNVPAIGGSWGRGHFIQITDAAADDVKTQWYSSQNGAKLGMRVQWGAGLWNSWRQLLTNEGGTISAGSVDIPITGTRFGYSPSYGVLKLGSTGTSGTISLYVDPSSNSSGSFNGNGNELLSNHDLTFVTPNPANNTFYSPLRFNSGNAWRPRVTAFHGIGASPVVDTGSKWQTNVNGKFSTIITNQNSAWDNSTGIFSPPVDGFYYFYFSALMDSSATGAGTVHRTAIRKNSVEQAIGYSNNAPTGYYHSMLACSCVIYCSTSDQITFRATSGNIHTGSETHWGGYLL